MNKKEEKIYKEYVALKSKGGSIVELAKKHNVHRGTIYNIVERVENGNKSQERYILEEARLERLWILKYLHRFNDIPSNRKAGSVALLNRLIEDMYKDGFPQIRIAKLIHKSRSTVIHHLKNNGVI